MFDKYIHEDVEQSIISRFMLKPEEISHCHYLESKHFIFETNRKIFETLVSLQSKNSPITPKTVCDESGVDMSYITALFKDCSLTDITMLSKYLVKESEKYNALVLAKELIEKVEEDKNTDIFSELSNISLMNDNLDDKESTNESILSHLEQRMKNGVTGIPTKIAEIDESINALQKGRLYVVGARPSMGKSAFMCSLVDKMEKEHKVGILSLEMNTEELKQRIACLRANIKHWKIERGRCSGEEFDAYATALFSIKNVIINDKGGLNRSQVVGLIRSMVKKAKCEVVFIDHIGLIKIKQTGNLAHEIGEVTSDLKALSKELQIPIVCLCQLNRFSDKAKNSLPKISDLRDSGRIEEDADCVILLYRDNYYNPDGSGIAKYVIGKCRNGKTGIVDGFFEAEMMRWS